MTGTDIVNNARILVNDVDESTWSDADFIKFLNEGVRYFFTQQPDSRLKTNGTLKVFSAISALANTIDLDDEYFIPLTEYVCFRFFSSDSGDARDKERAQRHYNSFLAFIRPV